MQARDHQHERLINLFGEPESVFSAVDSLGEFAEVGVTGAEEDRVCDGGIAGHAEAMADVFNVEAVHEATEEPLRLNDVAQGPGALC